LIQQNPKIDVGGLDVSNEVPINVAIRENQIQFVKYFVEDLKLKVPIESFALSAEEGRIELVKYIYYPKEPM